MVNTKHYVVAKIYMHFIIPRTVITLVVTFTFTYVDTIRAHVYHFEIKLGA